MEDGVVVHRRVESGVVAERSLGTHLAGLHIPLDHEVALGRDFQRLGDALDEVDRFLAGKSGEEDLVDAVGKRGRGGQGEGGITTETDGDGHLLAALVVALSVAGSDLMNLPVHPGGLSVVDLDAVHADIPLTGVRVLGVDGRQGDEASSILRPALQDRQMIEREGFPVIPLTHAADHLLTGGALHAAGAGMNEIDAVAQELEGVLEALRRLRLHQELELGGKLIDRIQPQRHCHAALRSEGIDRDGEFGDAAVDGRLLEEQRLPSTRRLHLAVGDLRDLEFRGHGFADAAEFAGIFKGLQESGVGWIGHG